MAKIRLEFVFSFSMCCLSAKLQETIQTIKFTAEILPLLLFFLQHFWNLENVQQLGHQDSRTWSVSFGISSSQWLVVLCQILSLIIRNIRNTRVGAGSKLSPWISENNRKHENPAGERVETRTLYDHTQEKVSADTTWSRENNSGTSNTNKYLVTNKVF